MAGFREFVTGEVLTAGNVMDFLQKQAVMKFADAAARDAALGTAVVSPNALREGMVAYLDSTDTVQFYDGTAWDAISQPPAGVGSNVVVATLGTNFTTTSATYQDTGLSATITPTAASSKVFALVTGIASSSGVDDSSDFAIFRGDETGTNIAEATIFVGISQLVLHGFALSAVDSPATASAQTYTLAIRRVDADNARVNADTRMILIEVAA